jgi:hypothetical protein
MYDSEFYSELAKRIKAGSLKILDVNGITIKAGSLEVRSPSGFAYDAEILIDGMKLQNCTRIVFIADGSGGEMFIALELESFTRAFNECPPKEQYCKLCRSADDRKENCPNRAPYLTSK